MENQTSEIIIYQSEDGVTKIDVRMEEETVWLSQAQMAELFQTSPQNITIHIKNVYDEGELVAHATCKEYLQVQTEGAREVSRNTKFYNLDVIISGFPVYKNVILLDVMLFIRLYLLQMSKSLNRVVPQSSALRY
jgi:hypothetical protein